MRHPEWMNRLKSEFVVRQWPMRRCRKKCAFVTGCQCLSTTWVWLCAISFTSRDLNDFHLTASKWSWNCRLLSLIHRFTHSLLCYVYMNMPQCGNQGYSFVCSDFKLVQLPPLSNRSKKRYSNCQTKRSSRRRMELKVFVSYMHTSHKLIYTIIKDNS